MSENLKSIVAPFYCQMALKLCTQARSLCEAGECTKRSEICGYISTLCREREASDCLEESNLCDGVAEICARSEVGSADCVKAKELCAEARRLCPYNYTIQGG